MGNILKMEKQILIEQLSDLGWSFRKIERETGIRRETISKYVNLKDSKESNESLSNPAKVPTEQTSKAAKVPADENNKKTEIYSRSNAAAYDSIIKDKLKEGLSSQRIYQDLKVEYEVEISYDSIKRYVRKLKTNSPKVFSRLHSLPGEEGQVDFGLGAPTLKDGKYKKPYLFKMVLSYSRHSFEKVVWRQDEETFFRCHEEAFQAFGGVPEVIKLDNLKAGVIRANKFDPELNPVYLAFSKHWGFAAVPCLPRKPEHKGKTEAGVKYTQDNALKGKKFNSLDEQNAYLRQWNKTWARTRIHGTTKTQVWKLFVEDEKQALKPLAQSLFEFFKIAERTVHADSHIEVSKCYYSVPHRFLGQRVIVHFNSLWVKVFDKSNNQIASHRANIPGKFKTEKSHLPPNKTFSNDSYKRYLLEKCRDIGEYCLQWAESALNERGILAFRSIQGILHLHKKYSAQTLNKACYRSICSGSIRYQTVVHFCNETQKIVSSIQKHQQHELIRNISTYSEYLKN